MSIKWETVAVKQVLRGSGEAFASIGEGRITLNTTACGLIENMNEYPYVEIQYGKENTKIVKLGLSFCKEKTENAIRTSKLRGNGTRILGLNIYNKFLVESIFGKTRGKLITRHPIEKINDEMLAIDITKTI